ncbi:MAG TPA: hypothetical protein PLW93_02820 [Candidatus Absconditabacterales bacterium]|nr:hypothetical protein [Candidatus Absconditabacterales bacterium]HNG97183.1 hypothetical protein [Candidatus Absconditabacterales bacterium]
MKLSDNFNSLGTDSKKLLQTASFVSFLFLSSCSHHIRETLDNINNLQTLTTHSVWEQLPDTLQELGSDLLHSVLNKDNHVFQEHEGVTINEVLFIDSYSDHEGFKARIALWGDDHIAQMILDLKLDPSTGAIWYHIIDNENTLTHNDIISGYGLLFQQLGILVHKRGIRIELDQTNKKGKKLYRI